ncbi:MAG TPA: mannonate dehydratase, partial [Chitinophagaceae bacterium]|nr:mannonate dehydratase [Chitinophagaceae bacterium]
MNNKLKQTWRWYGPEDSVTLQDVKQAGASGIVSALHQVPHGQVWTIEEIKHRKDTIEAAGLTWDVVESVNVHEDIKTRSGDYKGYIEKYKETLRHLATCGIKTVCYNFMPVLDWTRTQLDFELANGSKALRFDWVDLAVFDVFIIERKGAAADYNPSVLSVAEERFKIYDNAKLRKLSDDILMGVPGEASATKEGLLRSIKTYKEIGRDGLRENLAFFLNEIMDTCEENGIN